MEIKWVLPAIFNMVTHDLLLCISLVYIIVTLGHYKFTVSQKRFEYSIRLYCGRENKVKCTLDRH
jgi:uncharacterized membrane protein